MKGNGRGPENKGPGTGRKMGFCYGWGRPGYENDEIPGAPSRLSGHFDNGNRKKIHNQSELMN
ncbi:MAG: DUF5320 domain-containing protein [Spirochaetales bacterium]|nr:DUF5320 domain-containing protein [Spirochaetales bacterium]